MDKGRDVEVSLSPQQFGFSYAEVIFAVSHLLVRTLTVESCGDHNLPTTKCQDMLFIHVYSTCSDNILTIYHPYRKKNAATIEAQAAAAARQEALKAEAARQEREAEAIRHRKRRERQHRREQDARGEYERRWLELLLPSSSASATNPDTTATSTPLSSYSMAAPPIPALLGFADIPWPIFHGKLLDIEDLSSEAISSFLFPVTFEDEDSASKASKKKEKLRETMLKFHPDKFEGRIMKRVREEEREKVREGVSAVVRATSALMQAAAGG